MQRLQAAGLALLLALPLSVSPARAEPLLVGVFAGDLACVGCKASPTELTLVRKASGWAEGRYLMKQTSLGKPGAARVSTGEWTTLRGDAANPDAVVYELDPDSPDRAQHFLKVGEGRVRALDLELRRLPAGVPSVLARRTRRLPGPAAVTCLQRGGVPAEAGTGCARAR